MNNMEYLYLKEKNVQSRLASFENPNGEKGRGGTENGKAKGRPSFCVKAGTQVTLLDVKGSGIIDRIWMTNISLISGDLAACILLRSVKIDMYWDSEDKPAVSAPLGDFFGASLGKLVRFESALLSSPEGRSLVSYFSMPFLTGARIILTNESTQDLDSLFYDIAYRLCPVDKEKILYFHAFWNRENPTKLCRDYTILPRLEGEGKYIGTSMGAVLDSGYERIWFGEGEVKIYLDGDDEYPTICGTGTEDYVGTGYGMKEYANRTQGCPVANKDNGIYTFYRFHIEDAVHFYQDIKIEIQVMGYSPKYILMKIIDKGMPVKIISGAGRHLYETDFKLERNSADGGYKFYMTGDYSSTAYFYYDKPASILPELPPVSARTANLR